MVDSHTEGPRHRYADAEDGDATNAIAEPARIYNLWSTEFAGMHRENGCFVLTCHPWVSGRASRIT